MAIVAPTPHAEAQAGMQTAAEGGMQPVGQMLRPDDFYYQRPMAVDETRSLGFVSNGHDSNSRLHLMDLDRLVSLDSTPQKNEVESGTSYTPETSLALDTKRERLYAAATYPSTTNVSSNTACGTPTVKDGDGAEHPSPVHGLPVFDYRLSPDGQRRIVEKRMGPMPCTGSVQFFGLTNSYDAVHDRLYMGGVPASERWRYDPSDRPPIPTFLGGTMEEDRGQSLLLRQLRIDGEELVPLSQYDTTGAAQLRLEWEVDLRIAGCGRRNHLGRVRFEGFVARLGDEVLAYCWDTRPYRGLSVGPQGYLVRIPLAAGNDGVMRPRTRGGAPPLRDPLGPPESLTNYVYHRTPTLPGDVTAILDHVSGRVLLVTTGPVNGNAVWVFDPRTERFVGVVTGGYADEPRGNTAVGFDSAKGRVYLLTQHGILIAPVRSDPLPAGLIYPVLVNTDRREQFVSSDRISVAPALGRLFVAMNDNNNKPTVDEKRLNDHYEVLEDHVLDPPAIKPVDPDSLTTDIAEEEGRTAASASGQAIASGAHVVNTGGIPRAVGQNDPTCVFSPPNRQVKDAGETQDPIPDWEVAPAVFGSCLPELIVSGGHREAAVAGTELEAGTGSGATARGAALLMSSNDTGTDGDVRRFSDCGADTPDRVDRWGRRWLFPDNATTAGGAGPDPILNGGDKKNHVKNYNEGRDAFWNGWKDHRERSQAQYVDGCAALQDGISEQSGPDLRAGTKGPDGKGFPIPAATCGDFGGQPSAESWPDDSAGQPVAGYPSSSATCDASVPAAQTQASVGALAIPSASDPQLSVARVSSKVATVRTPEGQVTMALAVAEGVTVGPLSIGQVRSLAVTRAHGHPDTASASLLRQWCGVRIAGAFENGCVDPDTPQIKDLLNEVNAAALQKVQLSVPEGFRQATPKGYQAVVTKHPGQRGGDQAVNDDDSHTVSAFQAVIYNDGPRGRSRLVVQLAGVHAESRYGIIELPNFDFGGFEPTPDPGPLPDDLAPAPVDPISDPAPVSSTPVDTFTPDSFVEDEFGAGADEFVRFSAPPPSTVRVPGPRGNPLERVVRVPVRVLSDAINLLVQNPREAALLFVMWGLLAAPVYLGLRRRSFARALVAG